MTAKSSLVQFVTNPRFEAGLRAVLFVAILVAGWHVGRSYVRLFAEWRQLARPAAASPADSRLDSLAAVLPLAGQWSFSEMEWNIRMQSTSAREVAAAFETMTATPPTESDELLPDVDEKLFDLIDNSRMEPVIKNGNRVYNVDRRDLKAQLVTRSVAGREKTVGLAVAYSQPEGTWQLTSLTPRAAAARHEAAAPHLLPLPTGARRSGGRFGDDGRLLMELVELQSGAETVLSTWKNAGWEIRPSGMGDDKDFSYLCVRGDEVVYAWSADPRDALQDLMLVRTPDGSDTKTESP